jgi:hypothetical protein
MNLALFSDLNFAKVFTNLRIMLFFSWTLCHTCLFIVIRAEGGVKFMKHDKGGESYISLWTSGTDCTHGRTTPFLKFLVTYLSKSILYFLAFLILISAAYFNRELISVSEKSHSLISHFSTQST